MEDMAFACLSELLGWVANGILLRLVRAVETAR